MKTTKTVILFAMAICIGFAIAQLCRAESTNKPPRKESAYKEGVAMQGLSSLVRYLQDTKQTNALKQLNDFLFYQPAHQDLADMNFTLVILQNLRDGKTTDILDFLENQLDFNIDIFGKDYHMMPTSVRGDLSLKALQRAYDYRSTFPFKSSGSYVEGAKNAFKFLNQTN